jgi:hypothetical protein
MAQPQNTPPQGSLQIEIPQTLEPTYSNLVVIQHSPSEIILDFTRVLPNMPSAKVGARIIMPPMHAKLLLRALSEHIERFEAQFGPIYVPQGDGLTNQLFGGGQAE